MPFSSVLLGRRWIEVSGYDVMSFAFGDMTPSVNEFGLPYTFIISLTAACRMK